MTKRRFELLEGFFGDIETAWQKGTLADFVRAKVEPHIAETIISERTKIDLEREQHRLDQAGVRLVTCHDSGYPERLKEVMDYPHILYIKGQFEPSDCVAVSVVGTRRATSYGIHITELLCRVLVEHGITMVSGAARGIDTCAHREMVEHDGRTIAVFGTGLDRFYPSENRKLMLKVVEEEQGALVSEFPFDTEPEPYNFPRRNRIISGLGLATVVIEAGEKSGALITAHSALSQNRDVLAVPGPITSPQSRGTNDLIRQGATPLCTLTDVLESLGIAVAAQRASKPAPEFSNDIEKKIYETLGSVPMHINQLSKSLEISAAELGSILVVMEVHGMIREAAGSRYIRG